MFYHHPLLQNYRYYWRVEPDVHFFCDLSFDPFVYMQENNKVYGFNIAIYEFESTIQTLWSTVIDFLTEYPQYLAADNAMHFISDNGGQNYNNCHFWSNFEIADMDFWRGEAYEAYFKFLDSRGGFYYERWGDAPVHSIGAALFAGKDRIHYFREIGYEHWPFAHCPIEEHLWEENRCSCNPADVGNWESDEGLSCLPKWDRIQGQGGS